MFQYGQSNTLLDGSDVLLGHLIGRVTWYPSSTQKFLVDPTYMTEREREKTRNNKHQVERFFIGRWFFKITYSRFIRECYLQDSNAISIPQQLCPLTAIKKETDIDISKIDVDIPKSV